jgi:aminoglycoside phosphotransferase (APT) family kinase protein
LRTSLPADTEVAKAPPPGHSEVISVTHADIRAGNLLLTPARVFVVGWPWACLAQPWLDLPGMPTRRRSTRSLRPSPVTSLTRAASLRHLACRRFARSSGPRAKSRWTGSGNEPAGNSNHRRERRLSVSLSRGP